MNLVQRWHQEYQARRYMEFMELPDLHRRSAGIFTNLLTLTDDCKIGCLPVDSSSATMWRAWTHVLQEFGLRGLQKEDVLAADEMLNIPRPSDPVAQRAAELLQSAGLLNLTPGTFLVKFGMREHMEQLVVEGKMRISPAKSYQDASLNPAIRDDELVIEWEGPGKEFTIQPLDPVTREPTGPAVPLEGQVKGNWTLPTNYYVSCFAQSLDGRLFQDFGYDACVVITDPPQFFQSLIDRMAERAPLWIPGHGLVTYVDPLHPPKDRPDIFMSKHFRYSYQHEYRIAWIPQDAQRELRPIELELGILKEYCQLFSLQ